MKLVYTVKPLPESFFYFLWNYDKLEEKDEKNYIEKIILTKNKQKDIKIKWTENEILTNVAKCIFES